DVVPFITDQGGSKGEGTWKLTKDGFCTTWKGSKANCFKILTAGDNKCAEYHLVLDIGRRCGERLTGEEGRLDFVRCKRGGKGGRGDGDDSHAGDEQSAHGGSPWMRRLHDTANRGEPQQRLQHRRQDAVGRPVPVQESLDVDDHLLAHVDAAFERGR